MNIYAPTINIFFNQVVTLLHFSDRMEAAIANSTNQVLKRNVSYFHGNALIIRDITDNSKSDQTLNLHTGKTRVTTSYNIKKTIPNFLITPLLMLSHKLLKHLKLV